VDVTAGGKPSDEELRGLWLRRVQTKPADFLRAKFAFQARQSKEGSR
jgi:Ca-activated chloride channel family protein